MGLLSFLLILVPSLHWREDYAFFQWLVGLIVCSVPISIWVTRKTSKLFGFSFFLASFYVFFEVFGSMSVYAHIPGMSRIAFSLAAMNNYVCAVIPMLALLMVDRKYLDGILNCLPLYTLVNSLYVIITACFGIKFVNAMGFSGFLDYSGMNGVLIAITVIPSISILFKDIRNVFAWVVTTLAVAAIFLSRGSIPYGVLACGIGGLIVSQPKGIKWVLRLLPIAVIPIAIALISEGKELFDSGQRFQAYKIFMGEWWSSGWSIRLTGFGPSSFQLLSKGIQEKVGFMVSADGKQLWSWVWLHSDYLQCVFEYGLAGAILVLGVLIQSLRNLYRHNDKTIFAIACGLASSAIFDYPCRTYVTSILVTWVIIYSYRCEETTQA